MAGASIFLEEDKLRSVIRKGLRFYEFNYVDSSGTQCLSGLPTTVVLRRGVFITYKSIKVLTDSILKSSPVLVVVSDKELSAVLLKLSSKFYKKADALKLLAPHGLPHFGMSIVSGDPDSITYGVHTLSYYAEAQDFKNCVTGRIRAGWGTRVLNTDLSLHSYYNSIQTVSELIDAVNGAGYTPEAITVEFLEYKVKSIVLHL